MVSAQMVRELRGKTGAGVMECKKALENAGGDMSQAEELLKKWGMEEAAGRRQRETAQGMVQAYIHFGGRVGVLVELDCETDFVARTPEFGALCRDVAMQVAAMKARYVGREDVPAEVVRAQEELFRAQAEKENRPVQVIPRYVAGKMTRFYSEACLLEQPFIRDPEKKVSAVIAAHVALLGENIRVRRFARFEVGELPKGATGPSE